MSIADEVAKLVELRNKGALTEAEFNQQKARVLLGLQAEKSYLVGSTGSAASGTSVARISAWKVAFFVVIGLIVMFFAIGFFVPDSHDNNRRYTGIFRIGDGTEYIAKQEPSNIGGACDGWNAIAVQRIGLPSTAITNLLCWKLEDGKIAVTSESGVQKTIAPISAWGD